MNPAHVRTARRIVLLLCLTLELAMSAWPQTTNSPSRPLTLEDALNYALQHYPAVRASLEQLSAAHTGIGLARTQYLPQLTALYQDGRATQNQVDGIWLPAGINAAVEGPVAPANGHSFWNSQAGALFSWEPVDFGLRSAIVGQARSVEAKSQADVALTRLQVASAVGSYFLMAAANHQAVLAAQANVERWQTINKSIHVLVDNQLRPGVDASRADAQLAIARTQSYQAQQVEQGTLAMLAALMGTAGTDVRLETDPLLNLPAIDSLPNLTPQGHPLARNQMAVVGQVQAQEKVLDRTDYPKIFLQAEGFGRGSGVPNNPSIVGNLNGLAPERANWVAGLTIAFPNIFDLKALGDQKQISKANERAQKALYDKTIQDLTGQIQAALAQLKSAQLVAQQTPIELGAARQSETQSRTRYEAGLATLVEVADAEGLLAQAELDDAAARINVWRSLFGLAYAQGDLQPFLQAAHAGGN